jgi:WD40 repeat protein
MWSLHSQHLSPLTQVSFLSSLSFSSHEKSNVLTGSNDGMIKIWELSQEVEGKWGNNYLQCSCYVRMNIQHEEKLNAICIGENILCIADVSPIISIYTL